MSPCKVSQWMRGNVIDREINEKRKIHLENKID